MKLLLLPGMDGTGLLFRPLIAALPSHIEPIVHAYDSQRCEDYDTLFAALPTIDEPYAVLGESFSGPLAIRRAAIDPNVRALILTASFARAPRPALAWLARLGRPVFQRPPPRAVVKHVLIGPGATEAGVDEVHAAITQVRGAVLAHRLQQVVQVDVTRELDALRCPLLYLQGKHDRLVPSSCGARITRAAGRSLHSLNAGHLLLQSRAGESAALISNSIATLQAS